METVRFLIKFLPTFASMSISRKTGSTKAVIRSQSVFAVSVHITNDNGGITFVIVNEYPNRLERQYTLIMMHNFKQTIVQSLLNQVIHRLKKTQEWVSNSFID